jgi:hypothetical protein
MFSLKNFVIIENHFGMSYGHLVLNTNPTIKPVKETQDVKCKIKYKCEQIQSRK